MAKIAVVGGTRFFGRLVVARLLERGDEVTLITRGRTPDPFADRLRRRIADANDVVSLAEAASDGHFDAVVHQMIYSPLAAEAALKAFEGRTTRLVMTSTIEVYAASRTARTRGPAAPIGEDELDLATVDLERDRPWRDPSFLEANYGSGKRQAEAALYGSSSLEPSFDVATVRAGHVLAEQGDFTGRLRSLVRLATDGIPIRVHRDPGPSSFAHAGDLADFLVSVADGALVGPVNAASPDPLTTYDLVAPLGGLLPAPAEVVEVEDPEAGEGASPFTWPHPFHMGTGKADSAGLVMRPSSQWLPGVVRQTWTDRDV